MNTPPWLKKKLVEPQQLEARVSSLRKSGRTIASLNGSFDLLHAGHLYIIHQASLQADVLLVALNSDASIRAYKNSNRPIIPLNYRLEMMAALEFVDFVTWFEETDPCALLSKVRPDVHVNGAEYGAHCIEAEVVRSFGGRMHLVDRIPSLSTSSIIEKMQEPASVIGFRRFSEAFWRIFDSFAGGNIRQFDITPRKRVENSLKNPRKSTETDD